MTILELPHLLRAPSEDLGRLDKDEDSDWEDEAAAQASITNLEARLALGTQDSHRTSHLVIQLLCALKHRYACTTDTRNLEQMLHLCQSSLASDLSSKDPDREVLLRMLGWTLTQRYDQSGAVDDLNEAFQCYQIALEICPLDHSSRNACLNGMGSVFLRRYTISRQQQDVTQAIEFHQEALRLDDERGRSPHTSLRHLGSALFYGGQTTRNRDSLAESIRVLRELLHIRRTPYNLSILSHSLRSLYKESSKLTDLEESVALARESVRSCQHKSYRRPSCAHALAAVLWVRFVRMGEPADIDEAIILCEEAQTLTKSSPFYGVVSSLLAISLQSRFMRFARMGDLDRAISLQRSLLALPFRGAIQLRTIQGNLANNLRERFYQNEEIVDLEEAVSLKRISCMTTKADISWLTHMIGLGAVLLDLFIHTHSFELLNESISVLQASTEEALLRNHFLTKCSLINLGSSLLKRYELLRIGEDIDHALNAFLHTLDLCGIDSAAWRYEGLDGLSSTYRGRFECLGDSADAYSAMTYRQEALQIAEPGHLSRSPCLFEMARLYLMRNSPYFSLVEACRCIVQGVVDDSNRAQRRLSGAIEVLSHAEIHFASATNQGRSPLLEVYVEIISLFPRVAYFGLDVQSRLRVLSKANNLGILAAIHAIALTQLPFAMELLEEGRGTFWTQALRVRMPVDDLPILERERLKHLYAELERESSSKDPEAEAVRKRQVSEELEVAFQSVRAIQGFDRFMLRNTFASLARSAERGAVVTLISGTSCHALLLRGPGHEVEHIGLPDLDTDSLLSLRLKSNTFFGRNAGKRAVRMMSVEGRKGEDVLKKLWHAVVQPILSALKYEKRAGNARPRLFWMPTGAFSFLPLHAAGTYKDKTTAKEDCCSDYVVSSYTPTLRVLLHAHRPMLSANGGAAPSVLLAAAPMPPSWRPLHFAREELEVIKHVVSPSLITDLPDATLASMLDALPTASVVHVACHGKQDTTNALDSGFILADGTPLTVAQLMALDLPRAALAVLSACETAKGDEAQPDQAVHLAAAMLFVGFRSVVATMWEMGDQDGPFIAKGLYEALFRDGKMDLGVVPYALDDAVRQLRARGLSPSRWATFIHQGA